jgi:hypothetical protein
MTVVDSRTSSAELLTGPRGRRLCWELHQIAQDRGDSPEGSAALFSALRRTVETAMYWQQPDDQDTELDDPAVVSALTPIAGTVIAAAATQWWATPVALDAQYCTRLLLDDDKPRPPELAGVPARLAAWRVDQQRVVERPENSSGTWWSTPNRWDVPVTTRDLGNVGPAGLWLVEDFMDWMRASCWPVAARSARSEVSPRIYEIQDQASWAELVQRFPLDVTDSRRPDWKRATGRDGSWLLPDYPAVASEFDGLHLTVYGYLTTAGVAVSTGATSATVLAGWAPDETYWLTDVLDTYGEATDWARDRGTDWHALR